MIESKRVRLKGRKAQLHIFFAKIILNFSDRLQLWWQGDPVPPFADCYSSCFQAQQKARKMSTDKVNILSSRVQYIFPWILIMDPMSVLHYMPSRKIIKRNDVGCWNPAELINFE